MAQSKTRLKNVKTGKTKEFDEEHARNILKYEKARGFNEWILASDANHSLDKDGNLIKRGGPATDKGAETPKGDTSGESKAEQA